MIQCGVIWYVGQIKFRILKRSGSRGKERDTKREEGIEDVRWRKRTERGKGRKLEKVETVIETERKTICQLLFQPIKTEGLY